MSRSARKAQRQIDLENAPVPSKNYISMDKEQVERAFQVAREAYMKRSRGEIAHWQDIAKLLKEEFDTSFKGSKAWNCIVGKSFGSFVSFNTKDMAYFHIAEMGVMLWKHG
mmetsp:Transcript_6167/g.7544  ORF Transcript_6167/g.7544 Transcript_6167/m.7544 type:complete len:111 (+) Transcript_6167:117-449(+)|eukprot:jgi/Bigna1/50020/estExt_Genewise1.C_630106